MFGYFLYGLGIVMTIHANQGLAPWEVFHQGLAFQLGTTMGTASQIVGAAVILLDIIFGERIGWGTIGNVIFIGFFVDLFILLDFIPIFKNIWMSYTLMLTGMFTISLATYFYLSAQMGAGPRDGLMIAFTKRSNLQVGLIRNAIEICILTAGYFLGGKVGPGTVVMAIFLGRFIQLSFRIFKFNVKEIQHRYIDQDIAFLANKLKNSKVN